jgi:hypothetical protein
METAINYWWVVPVLIALLILVGWMIRRNVKDQKEYEQDVMQSEIKPRKHDEHGNDIP